MVSPVSSYGQPVQDCETQNIPPAQEEVSATEASISKIVKEMQHHPAATPPSDGSCPIMALTEGVNQPHFERLMFYLEPDEQTNFVTTCRTLFQNNLGPLLTSFGIAYPFPKKEEDKEKILWRIERIRESLPKDDDRRQKRVWTEGKDPTTYFSSSKEIMQNPKLLRFFLRVADRFNLVSLFPGAWINGDYNNFPKKITAVVDYLKQEGGTITELNTEMNNYIGEISNIPKEISFLKNLRKFRLYETKVTILSEEIGELKNLKTLNLSCNEFITLPKEICGLIHLRWLNLADNQLIAVPDLIAGLTDLQYLDLSKNNLNDLPEGIGKLKNLLNLILSKNNFIDLPEGISKLTELRRLNLSGNHLTDLPEGVVKLTKLQELDLSGNHLNDLPEGISKLTELRRLNLSGNHLNDLPEGVSKLTGLRRLNLSGNHLTDLPEWTGDLSQLKEFKFSEDQLNFLLEAVKKLNKQLMRIKFFGGLLMSQQFVQQARNFLERELNLSGERFNLCFEKLGDLSKLEKINLSDNRLTALPEWLSQLPYLETIVVAKGDNVKTSDSLKDKIRYCN